MLDKEEARRTHEVPCRISEYEDIQEEISPPPVPDFYGCLDIKGGGQSGRGGVQSRC
jgi:hypothetical protein